MRQGSMRSLDFLVIHLIFESEIIRDHGDELAIRIFIDSVDVLCYNKRRILYVLNHSSI